MSYLMQQVRDAFADFDPKGEIPCLEQGTQYIQGDLVSRKFAGLTDYERQNLLCHEILTPELYGQVVLMCLTPDEARHIREMDELEESLNV